MTQRRSAVATLVSIMSMMLLSTSYLLSQETAQQPAATASTQDNADQNIAMLRKDLRSQKKQIVAANMNLTESEAEKFWPVFEKYTDELMTINNKKYAAVKEYVQGYDTLTDPQAERLTRDALEVDQSVAQLRLSYIPIFEKVISPKKTALFMQIDRRLVLLIDLQLSSSLPLAPPQ
jgi:predicted negative regulator of RcsB-dependent stress response